MAYMKTSLIARPGNQDLGLVDDIKSLGSKALDFFGAGIKAQGAQEALAAQNAALLAAQGGRPGGGSGISTTTMLIGGLAVAGVLVFMLRKK